MCGISGFVDSISKEAASTRLEAMLSAIAYRGPDDYSGLIGPGFALGCARLSIVDLAGGAQPATTPDQRVGIVFNGEIFNYQSLRADLVSQGMCFETNSEVETLLRLYLSEGPGMVRRLNGQFAIAIWNGHDQSLLLLRDPFGIRPLFWWTDGAGRLVFGSEIKAVACYPGVGMNLDRYSLLQTMRFWTVSGARTAFAGINQVPPGHSLLWRDGQPKLERYWKWPFSADVEQLKLSSDAEYFEAFREEFDRSVCRQRMADVEVASYLSGGIDSAVVAQRLVEHGGIDQLKTFSVAFDDSQYDESGAQQTVVSRLGLRNTTLRVSQDDIARVFPEVVRHAETPLFRTAAAPLYLLSDQVRQAGIKVVMTGEGADEVLLGYDLFRESAIRRFWSRQPDSRRRGQLFRRLYAYLPQYQNRRYFNLLLDFYRSSLTLTDDRFYAMAVRWDNGKALQACLSQDMRGLADEYSPVDELSAWLPEGYDDADDIERAQAVEVATLLENYLLSSQGDRMTMAHSVEGRYPYLDLEFVAFAARLPRSLKLRGLRDKYILRQAYRDSIPEAVRNRPKYAYQAPEMKAFFKNGRPMSYVADLLSPSRVARDGLFDPTVVERLCQRGSAESGGRQGFRDNMMFVLILSTALLQDMFVTNRSSFGNPSASVSRNFRRIIAHG